MKWKGKMGPYQVAGFRKERRVDLLLRSESQRFVGDPKRVSGYHPYSHPARRCPGAPESHILLADIQSGNLMRACEDLARTWYGGAFGAQSSPTYKEAEKVLLTHGTKAWLRAVYGHIRWSTLR